MMYLYAQSGSQHAIKANTIKLYSSLAEAGQQIIEDYNNLASPYKNLERFILVGRTFRLYRVEADTGKVASKYMGKRLLEDLKEIDSLKNHFTKALLRN